MKAEEFKTTIVPLTGKLYRLALRFLGDTAEAQDAVQESFAKLWNMRERLATVNNIEAFATAVLRNYCLDKLKTNHSVPWDTNHEKFTKIFPESIEERFIDKDTAQVMKEFIQKLPEQQREILMMRDVEGLEFEEIQKITKTNLNHIRVTLSRARKTVRDEMLRLFNYERYVLESIKQ